MFKNLIAGLLLVSLSLIGCPKAFCTNILKSSDYINKNEKDATSGMLRLLSDAKKIGHAKVIIEKGVYHFYPEKALEKYCFISNHDDGLKRTPFPLIGFKNIEIVADSAQFIFHGLMVPFIIHGSENVKLSGFTIDWEMPLHSEMEVIATNEKDHTFDVKAKCPYEIRNGELIFLKEGYEHNLARSECWDPKTGAVAFNSFGSLVTRNDKSLVRFSEQLQYLYEQDPQLNVNRFRGVQLSLIANELSPGEIRISGHKGKLPEPGWIIVCKGENSLNRMAPAISVQNSSNISLTNVTVHHAGGMGIICEKTENITLDHFNVTLKKGSGRILTTTADATHFVNCRGLVSMKNCLFENMLDDGTNVHGTFVRIVDIIDKKTIGVHVGHYQQLGYDFANQGDLIGFVREGDSFNPYFQARLAGIEKINHRYYLLKFKEELTGIEKRDLLDNLEWYPKLTISGCTVRNNRARGFLLATPHKILCENNFFSSMKAAIHLNTSFANIWYESGRVMDCTIRNNGFGDNAYTNEYTATIEGRLDKSKDKFPFGKIIIENNSFNTFNPNILDISGVDSLVFKNNKVEQSGNYPMNKKGKPVLVISAVNHETIEGNQIQKGLVLKGNSVE